MPELGNITVRDTEFTISAELVGNRNAYVRLTTEYQGQEITASDIEQMRTKLMTATRDAAMSLTKNVAMFDGTKLRRGVLTGVHGGSGNPMIRWDGAAKAAQYTDTYRLLDGDLISADDENEVNAAMSRKRDAEKTINHIAHKADIKWREYIAKARSDG